MKRIILVQHCQSGHHTDGLTGGWTDTALTEKGRKQAVLVAQSVLELVNKKKVSIYTSDLKRAYETAVFIGRVLDLELIIKEELREINNGVAAGKTREWAEAHRTPAQGNQFDLDYREFEEAETWREFFVRISGCLNTIWNMEQDTSVVVTHGCALSYIIKWFFQFDQDQMVSTHFDARPGSISIIEENKYAQRTLKVFNDLSHLL